MPHTPTPVLPLSVVAFLQPLLETEGIVFPHQETETHGKTDFDFDVWLFFLSNPHYNRIQYSYPCVLWGQMQSEIEILGDLSEIWESLVPKQNLKLHLTPSFSIHDPR